MIYITESLKNIDNTTNYLFDTHQKNEVNISVSQIKSSITHSKKPDIQLRLTRGLTTACVW